MITIAKEFAFSASHILAGLDADHPCGRLHGHNYTLRVFLTGHPDANGFIIDYRKLEPIKRWIDETLDHRHLNDVFDFQTTVENMSRCIFEKFKPIFPQLCAIEMSETPKTVCRYQP
jgi:6-pyruvoyltetrahydropterin/6-carboxytetrahydropterin synthase